MVWRVGRLGVCIGIVLILLGILMGGERMQMLVVLRGWKGWVFVGLVLERRVAVVLRARGLVVGVHRDC